MFSQHARPKWWQVYLTLPLLIALFLADSRLKISTRGHQAVQIGIILLVYGLIHLWLKANTAALSRMDRGQNYGRVRVIRIPVSSSQPSRLLQLPDSEIKGMLNDTFEMDYSHAVSFPVDEVPQEVDKE